MINAITGQTEARAVDVIALCIIVTGASQRAVVTPSSVGTRIGTHGALQKKKKNNINGRANVVSIYLAVCLMVSHVIKVLFFISYIESTYSPAVFTEAIAVDGIASAVVLAPAVGSAILTVSSIRTRIVTPLNRK